MVNFVLEVEHDGVPGVHALLLIEHASLIELVEYVEVLGDSDR